MNTRRKLSTTAVVSTLMIGSFGVAFPALATSASACSGAKTCAYDGSYTGYLDEKLAGSGRTNMDAGDRNKLSSWINYSSTGSRFYWSTNGNGNCVPMYAQDRASASSSNPNNNEAESWAGNRIC